MKKCLGVVFAAAAFLVPATSAQAGFLAVSSGSPYTASVSLSYFDQSSSNAPVSNTVTIDRVGDTLRVTDSTDTITDIGSVDCTISADQHVADCPAAASATSTGIDITLGNGDDAATVNVSGSETPTRAVRHFVDVFISGGAGNDTINGSDAPNFTNDFIRSGTGNDVVNGRGGDDFLTDFDGSESSPTGDPGFSPQGGTNTIDGGAGDDFVNGGNGADTLRGGEGDDRIFTDTFDVVSNGNGDDVLLNTFANDAVDGGGGFDTINYDDKLVADAQGQCCGDPVPTDPGVTIKLNDGLATRLVTTTGNGYTGESDSLTSIEDANGTSFADNITGSAVSNVISGRGGNDTIVGGLGPDSLFGDDGDDNLQSADGEADRVHCGGNAGDKAAVDQVDLTSGCPAVGAGTTITNVANPNIPPPIPPDTTKPTITTKVVKKIKASVLRKKGIKCGVTSKDTVTNRLLCTLTAKVRSVKIATAGEIILAEKRATFTAKKTIRLKIAKKFRKAIKKKRKLRMLVQVTDQAGNTAAKRIVIRIT